MAEGSVGTASFSASVYDASIKEAELRVEKLQRDYDRHTKLLAKNASTPVIVEQCKSELDMANARVAAMRQQREAARSSVGEVSQRRENAEAAIQRAQAAVDMARLNLSYCVELGPRRSMQKRSALEEGQAVNAGQTITYIMPDTEKWVIANYKETQVENLHVGQKVKMTVDAINGKVFNGKITAISGATGSKYSLVPTDNSAGNFVKIQQRVPVRIEFEGLSKEDNDRLVAGMMVVVKAQL